MARRSDLKIQIDAESAKAEAAFERVRRSTMRMETQLREADLAAAKLDKQLEDEAKRAAQQRAADMEKLGRGLVVFGAATLAGLGMAAKAAISWESAWAGVRKTVEGTPQELAALEGELRGLATTLPATHQEIAAVAEAAGQLGVATPDVAAFTKVMVDLGETTNLTADEAATAIAQMMNIMQSAPEDVDNLAAALVDLGNNGASTEKEILDMALRIAGAGQQIGMTEADVLALSNAMASLGIRSEAGGSAMSKVMADMGAAVTQGGAKLEGFANVAGVSAQEFARAFRTDPAAAIATFVSGLGGISAAGGDVFTTLDDLGLGSIRVRDMLLRLAGGGDILTDSLARGAQAWEENTALVKEAEQRYDTAEAKIQIARNTLVDLGIDIGGVVLPYISSLAETVADVARWFGDLPGPVKTAATVFAGLAGSASLVGGGFLLMAPRIESALDLFGRLNTSAPRAAGAIRFLGRTAGALTGLGIAAAGMYALLEATKEAAPTVEEATQALLNLNDASKRMAMDQLIRQMRDVREHMDRSMFDQVVDGLRAFGSANALAGRDAEEFNETMTQFDRAIASMVASGNMDLARESAQMLFNELGVKGDFKDLVERHLPEYANALLDVDNQQQMSADAADQNTAALERQAAQIGMSVEEMQAAESAAKQQREAWAEAAGSFVDFTEAYDIALSAKEERERETAEATAEATEDAEDSWEDYVGNVTLTVDEYLAQLERMVENQQNWRDNLLELAGRVPDEMLQHFMELGPQGADAVALMAEMSDKELQRAAELWSASSAEGAAGITDELEKAGPLLRAISEKHGKDVADKYRDKIIAGKMTVEQAAKELGLAVTENVPGEIEVDVDLNTSKFNQKADAVDTRFHAMDGREAIALVDLDISRFRGQEGLVREASNEMNQLTPTPNANLATGKYEKKSGEVNKDLTRLGGRTATPTTAMDLAPFREKETDAHKRIDNLHKQRPTPKIDADKGPFDEVSSAARRSGRAFDRTTYKSTLDANSEPAHEKLRAFIQKAKEKITVTIDSIFGGSGGGGGFGGQASGGWRTPLNRGTYRVGGGVGSYPGHTGQDLPAPTGTGVYAARTGRVSRAMTMRGSYGNHVYIDHGGGWQTRYAHLSRRFVSAGQVVPAGRRIGNVGSTGNSTGPHLHFELRRAGRVLSPRSYIKFRDGGPVEGPGGPRDDQIPAWLSNGEFVMRADAVNRYGKHMMHMINDMKMPGIPHMASGGLAGSSAGGTHYGDTHVTVVAPMEQQVKVMERRLQYRDQARRMVGV